MEGRAPAGRAKLIGKNGSRHMSTSRTTGPSAGALVGGGLAFACLGLRASWSSRRRSAASAAGVSAQQTANAAARKKEITIEELFLQSVEFQILREKAFSGDYDIKMSALDDLEKKVNDGSYKAQRPAGGVRSRISRAGRIGAHHARSRAPGEQLPRGAAARGEPARDGWAPTRRRTRSCGFSSSTRNPW